MQNPNFGIYYKFKKFLLPTSQLFQQGIIIEWATVKVATSPGKMTCINGTKFRRPSDVAQQADGQRHDSFSCLVSPRSKPYMQPQHSAKELATP
ncbi:hypothetical protein X797_005929 [Metarhizium robertsii]|uniref:Uncharacterized protein n=1 Tax=Metarhizium robertsii TaxID=568076 RepID=A0A0A1UUL8_9HYPO|nr:hypothetical protein X797_005929 [Metarhizium robertsii]